MGKYKYYLGLKYRREEKKPGNWGEYDEALFWRIAYMISGMEDMIDFLLTKNDSTESSTVDRVLLKLQSFAHDLDLEKDQEVL